MFALLGSGIVVAGVLAACYIARKRRLEKPARTKTDPTLTSEANILVDDMT